MSRLSKSKDFVWVNKSLAKREKVNVLDARVSMSKSVRENIREIVESHRLDFKFNFDVGDLVVSSGAIANYDAATDVLPNTPVILVEIRQIEGHQKGSKYNICCIMYNGHVYTVLALKLRKFSERA